MTFLSHTTAPDPTEWLRVQLLEAWRRSARLVSMRWDLFLDATPDGREDAFAAYAAALDAEAAAADALAKLSRTDCVQHPLDVRLRLQIDEAEIAPGETPRDAAERLLREIMTVDDEVLDIDG
jgi:hypothetical protein